MNSLQNAGPGLKKMFIAQIATIVCAIVAVIPIVGFLGMIGLLAFMILSMIGLNQAGKDIEGCKTAFLLTIVNIVISILSNIPIFASGFLGSVITILQYVLEFLIIYFVCKSVADAMEHTAGEPEIAKTGHTVWIINLICYAANILLAILGLIPFINILAAFSGILIGILELVGSILYMIFLYKCYKALE